MWKNLIDSNLVKRNFQKIYSRKKTIFSYHLSNFQRFQIVFGSFCKVKLQGFHFI